jgi:rhamnulokinase
MVSREEIYRKTGIQFMRFNTLYQLLAMRLAGSSDLRLARSLLMIPDLFNFWFCRKRICEFTNATTTQFFNPFENDWATDLLKGLGIPSQFLLEVVQPATRLGSVDRKVAAELDLGQGNVEVVATTSHDTASAVVATPLDDEDDAYISSGTWSLIGAEVTRPVVNEATLSSNFTNEGGAFKTFRLLRNVQGLWLLQECKRAWSKSGRDYTYDQLSELARRAKPFKHVIDVDDSRLTTPADMPLAIATCCVQTGQLAPRTDAETARCIFDSLAIKYRIVILKLEDLLGRRINNLHIVGGGCRNSLLNQLVADATGKRVVAGPAEATSVGNALVQCAAFDLIKSRWQLRDVVRKSFKLEVYEPRKENRDAWDRLQEIFEKMGSKGFVE